MNDALVVPIAGASVVAAQAQWLPPQVEQGLTAT